MPVDSHETHLLIPPPDEGRRDEECICKGGQGRTAADLESSANTLLALAVLAVVGWALCLVIAALK